ncbi:MAG: hypothetical protein HHJ11_11215 [Phycicoccus sp.]|nr:hypothetical protein [Phycicoccus sp.]
MADVSPSGAVEVLQYLHGKLEAHFRVLRDQRSALEPVPPVFALEHDLGEAHRGGAGAPEPRPPSLVAVRGVRR